MAVTSRHNKYTSIPDWFSGQSTETAKTSPISQTVYIGGSSSTTIAGSTVNFKDIPIDNSTIVWQNEQLTVPIDNDKIIIVDGKVTTSVNASGVWELRQLADGTNYIYTTYPVVTQLGITMYADTEGLDIVGIYDGLPIDNATIYWDLDSNGNKVLKAIGSSSGGGVADSVAWVNVIGKPTWLLDDKISYSEIVGTPDLSKFVTHDLDERITGIKSFVNGLKIGESLIKQLQEDVVYIDANLVVKGGVTMYGSDSTFTPSTIMDAIVVDGITISKDGGVLKVIGDNNGGVTDSIAWGNILDKPYWITDSVPVIGISGVNVSLGSGITQVALRTALGLGSNAYSSTTFLPSASYTSSDVFAKVLSLDGSDSGLDADLLDGKHYLDIINGNVASATKLQTARTIWGRSFDGTGDVSGTLSGVYDIDFASKGNYVVGTFDKNANTIYTNNIHSGKGNNLWLKSTADTYITNSDGTTKFLTILSTGNVGIGTTSPSSRLHVNGNILATGNATLNQLITTDPTGIRLSYGNYGTLLRSDGDNFYILLTNSGNALNGTWNDLRPFRISSSTGDITMESNLSVTKYFAIGSRFRVNSAESTNSFGFFKSNIANQNNVGIAHLGTNYGGTTDINRTDLDMTAISMYRGVVGIGKEYDYSSIRSIYDSGVNLGVPTGVLIGLSKLIYKDSILGISSETSIGQTLHVYSSGTNFTQGIRVYQNGTGYAGLMLGGADLTTTAGTTVRSWFISTNSNDRFSISKGGFEPTDSIAFGYNGQWLVNGGDLVVSSNILATGGITMYSAKKLKNIKDERGLSLEELAIIKPTRYTWKDGRDDRLHIGGIADDVQRVLPEVIYKTGEDDTLTMDYGNAAFAIAASLINPVINHEEEIRVLKERIKELEEKVKVLTWNIA